MQFQISSRRKTGKEKPESSRLEFIEKFSANNFALSDAEDNTSRSLNRGGVTFNSSEEIFVIKKVKNTVP